MKGRLPDERLVLFTDHQENYPRKTNHPELLHSRIARVLVNVKPTLVKIRKSHQKIEISEQSLALNNI